MFSGGRGGNPIAANSSTVLSETRKQLPKPSERQLKARAEELIEIKIEFRNLEKS